MNQWLVRISSGRPSWAQLGMTCHALKRFVEAEGILGNVVDMRKRTLGQEHAYTLWAINGLSKIYRDQHCPIEAAQLLTKMLGIVPRTLGDEHIEMLMTKGNLARAYAGQNRWLDAKPVFLEQVDELKRTLGPGHTETLTAESRFARDKQLGRVQKARELFVKLIPKLEQTFGSEHPVTLSAKGDLAAIYKQQGRAMEAQTIEVELLIRNEKMAQAITRHGNKF